MLVFLVFILQILVHFVWLFKDFYLVVAFYDVSIWSGQYFTHFFVVFVDEYVDTLIINDNVEDELGSTIKCSLVDKRYNFPIVLLIWNFDLSSHWKIKIRLFSILAMIVLLYPNNINISWSPRFFIFIISFLAHLRNLNSRLSNRRLTALVQNLLIVTCIILRVAVPT